MGWQAAGVFNAVIALCYVGIASLISIGLVRTHQVRTNPLALATAAIFVSCAAHHGLHSAHLLMAAHGSPQEVAAVRMMFGDGPSVAIDAVGTAVALTYLGLRRSYKALLSTPRMFDDRVRVAAEHALRDLAFTDVLTGIPNRAAYQQLVDRLADDDRRAVILFLDVDGFKTVNDTCGHDVGDRVLRDLAQGIEGALHRDEHVFRLGGDELVVIALGYDDVDVADLTSRVDAAVARPIPTRDEQLTIRASRGLAQGAARDIGPLLREADQDMYRVKALRAASDLGPVPH